MMKKVTLYHEASKGGFKQWSIWIEPDKIAVTVEWGIVGKTLQTSTDSAKCKGKPGTKAFKDEATCAIENYERQLRKKREEGYRETMESQELADYLLALDKNFVPAKPISSIPEEEVIAGLKDGTLMAQRKRDGRRTLALKTRTGEWKLYSRRMEDLTELLPGIVDVLSIYGVPNGTILDGEIVVDRDGDDDFRATGTFTNYAMEPADALARQTAIEASGGTVMFYVFDILYHDGTACWALPYSERYELMERYLTRDAPRVQLAFNYVGASLRFLQALVKAHGYEGLILWYWNKGTFLRVGGKPKRTGCAKWKPVKEQDFIATGFYLGSGELSNVVGGLNLEEYAPDGKTLRGCGNVGTGFDAETRAAALTWKYPCVVSIKFDSQEPTGKLRFPVLLKKHEDKTPDECIGVELDEE